MYTPNNVNVFLAAYSGALAGFAASPLGNNLGSVAPHAYINPAQVALAYAESFDTQWGVATATQLDVLSIQACCLQALANRNPDDDADAFIPANWNGICQSIIALVQEGDTIVAAQGIIPPSPPPGVLVVDLDGDTIPWSATDLFNNTLATATVNITGAIVGDQVVVTVPPDMPAGVTVTGVVASTGVVDLTANNQSGGPISLPILHTDVYTVRISS